MPVILNASTSSGLVLTPDTSGVLELQSNGTTAVAVSSGNLQFNSGYGSVATAFGCRAWVNFNGTGTVAIRASGNVSSITDGGVGIYTVNFTTAMPDANLSVQVATLTAVTNSDVSNTLSAIAAGSTRITHFEGAAATDTSVVCVAVFR